MYNDNVSIAEVARGEGYCDRGRDARCCACRERAPARDDVQPRACGCPFAGEQLRGSIQLGVAPDDCARCNNGQYLEPGDICSGCGYVGP